MADNPNERPHLEDVPGMWPSTSANSFRQQYIAPSHLTGSHTQDSVGTEVAQPSEGDSHQATATSQNADADPAPAVPSTETQASKKADITDSSGSSYDEKPIVKDSSATPNTGLTSAMDAKEIQPDLENKGQSSEDADTEDGKDDSDDAGGYAPIKTTTTNQSRRRPGAASRASTKASTGLLKTLSRKKTYDDEEEQQALTPQHTHTNEEMAEIERLMSRMFGRNRQAQSEDEQTRHVGLVFKNLTVKGMGLGAAMQPEVSDFFLDIPRQLASLFSKGRSKPPIRTIINDFTGCVRPGEMLLVLGQPGSGCSTFLKVLANQRFGFESIAGEVTYGGTDASVMAKNYRGEIVYNPEEDLHYATLSVKRTLDFALKTRTPGKESRNEGESRKSYRQEFLRTVAKLFWIEHTLGTKVGNEFVRGVSGGEKKRVSIAEAMITKASTQCWDNSSRGLDASTALEYVESLRSLTNMAHISTCVALYQAGESLYGLFDKVVLIHEGRCLYYGKAKDAAAYFEGLGFTRPDRWTTADFLTSVTDEHEREIKPGWEDRIPRSAEQFEAAYRSSEIFQHNIADIAACEQETEVQTKERAGRESKKTVKKNYTLPFHKQVTACTHRQFLVMFGDQQALIGKWGGILFQALIVGSLFYNLPSTSAGVFPRGGVLFFALLFNTLLALAELTEAFSSKPILLKHKSYSFYRPSAYAIAQTVVDVPLVLIQVFIFDVVVYFMSNLARSASQFFISILILWAITMSMYSFFRALGALTGSLDIASRFTGISIQIFIVYTGYLIPPTKMRPWFKWLIWVNPVQYGYEALMSNEFYNLDIQCEPPYLVPQGPNAAPQYQSCAVQGSRPGSTVVRGSDYIKTAYNYERSHLWRNFGIIIAFWIFFIFCTAVGMELQKPNAGGGAVTIFKRGKAPKSVSKAMEKGSLPEDEEKAGNSGENKLEPESSDSSEQSMVKGVAKNESVFTYQNINYTIPFEKGERQLLRDVQGFVRPGKLTALMGASGAGKTTLLNTLAQRINFGTVSGDFLVDGRPLPKSFQRATGFAEQMDVHEPTSTVLEALRFSALLRQPKEVPIQEKYDYCEKVLDLLEMRSIAGATIGKIGEGLNQEQRKRVTIGVELAAKPELLLFLDEPTSGLDSGAAFNIVRFLRKLADNGQALLVTIHQPSAVLFEYFDELLLLKSGGRVVYHGSLGKDSKELINYFESNGAPKCPQDVNPAEYMLEAIGAGNPDYQGQDWGDIWAASPEHQARTDEIQSMIESRRNVVTKALVDDREYAMPLSTQLSAVIKRTFVAYWRSPEYVTGKFILHVVTGLFNSFTFYHIGDSSIDQQSRLFSVFLTLTISPPLIQQLQPKFLQFRSIFESRESRSKIYSWFAFTSGATIVEIPYSIVAGTIYYQCWWWPAVGRYRTALESGYTWILLMIFEIYYVSFGQAIASFSPNELLASLLVPVFFLFVVSFCGVVVPFAGLPTFWQSWMYYLTPFRYILDGFLGVAVHGRKVQCESNEYASFAAPPGQTCDSYVAPYIAQAGGYVTTGADGLCQFCQYATGDEFAMSFNVKYSQKWLDIGVTIAFCAFNYMVVFFCSWLYLGGWKRIAAMFSRKEKKGQQHQPALEPAGEKA